MKILQVHNQYQQVGGEDVVVSLEKKLLENYGHEVFPFYRSNDEIKKYSLSKKISLFWKTTWSNESYETITKSLKYYRPDICHIHNTFPLISPSILYACNSLKIPTIITLHNYRLICVNGQFFRDNIPCENCLNTFSVSALSHSCYRNSTIQNLAAVGLLEIHKRKKTYSKLPSALICLSEFAKNKFQQAGFPESILKIKPNFIFNEEINIAPKDNYFLFIGRLEKAKGTDILIKLNQYFSDVELKIVGSGNEYKNLKESTNFEFTGSISREDVLTILKKCKALIFPSLWYEGMPLVILEAFSLGIPVIASNIGAIPEIVIDNKTGLLFDSGNINSLIEKLNWSIKNPEKLKVLGRNAFEHFTENYTPEKNIKILENIYEEAINNR